MDTNARNQSGELVPDAANRSVGRRPPASRGLFVWTTAWIVLLLAIFIGRSQAQIPKSGEIQRRYIPATELNAVMQGDRPGALLPVAEFEALLREAQEKSAGQPALPDGAVIARSDYAAAIENDRLRLTVRVAIRSFKTGWQTARIPVGGLGVLSSKLEVEGAGDTATSAPISRNPENADELIVFLNTPGTHSLVLELAAPLNAVASDQMAAFGLTGAPAGELTLEAPANKRLSVDGAELVRPAGDDQPAKYVVPIGNHRQIQLAITERRSGNQADAATFATTAIGVKAAPGEATWSARTRLSVFGRPLDRLECDVPSSLEITNVESMGLEGWELSEAGGGQTKITLTWRQPFDGLRAVQFRGVFSPGEEGAWSVPNLALRDVAAHTGVLVLERPAGVRLQVLQTSGLRQTAGNDVRVLLEPGEQPPPELDATSLYFQIWRENFTLEFRPAAKDRELQAAMTTLMSLDSQGVDLLSTVDLETRFAPLFDADIELPAAWQINSVTIGGQAVDWQLIPREAGRNRIRIAVVPPLNPGERRNITLSAHLEPEKWPVADDPVRLPIPEIRLPQAGVVEALYGITAEGDLDIAPVDLVGLDPARRTDLEAINRQLAPFGKTARLGYTYQDTVFQGQLEVRRLPARLAATCITLTRLEPEAVLSHLEAQLSIGGGGLRDLVINLPEAAGKDVRFRLGLSRPFPIFGSVPAAAEQQQIVAPVPNILEQEPQAPVNGVIAWVIKLDRYARGDFVLLADISQPRPAAVANAPQSWTTPSISVFGAERQTGAIGVEASDDQHLVVVANNAAGQPLERLDPIDFPPAHARPRERLVAAFSFHQPGWSVTVTEDRLTRTAMPTALVHSLKLASIVDSEGVRQTQADADLVAVGIQSIRVALPEGSVIWSALVDGRPIEIRRSEGAFTVPLSPVSPPETHRALQLIYAPTESADGTGPGTIQRSSLGDLRLRDQSPRFSVVTGAGDDQPLEILETTWQLHHPEEFELVEARGAFRPARPLEGQTWIHRILSLLTTSSGRGSFNRLLVIGAIVVVAWLLAVGRRKPWHGVVAPLILIAVLVMLLMEGISASRTNARVAQNAPAAGLSEYDLTSAKAPPAAREPAAATSAVPRFERDEIVQDHLHRSFQSLSDLSAPESQPLPMDAPPDGTRAGGAMAGETPVLGFGIDARSTAKDAPIAPGAAEAAPQPAKPATAQAAGGGDVARLFIHEGLLSVAFILEPPAGSVSDVFRTTSAATDSSAGDLNVKFADADNQAWVTLLLALAVAVIGWRIRDARLQTRIALLLLTVAAPIALRNLATVEWHTILNGIWLGGILTAILWTLRVIVRALTVAISRIEPREKPAATSTTTSTAILAIACLMSSAASAQEAQQAAPKPPAPPAVYFPYGDAADPLAARNVFVPQALFQKLWDKAHPDQVEAGPAPVDGVVSAASFVLDVGSLVKSEKSTAALVQGRILLHNFRENAVKLTLPFKTSGVRSAVLDGKTAVVEVAPGSGTLSVVVPESGAHVLDVLFEHLIETTGPAGRTTWITDPVASGRLTIRLPAGSLEARVDGTRTTVNAIPQDGDQPAANAVELAIDRGGQRTISWQPPTERSIDELPLQLNTTAAAFIDDAGLTLRSHYALRIRQGSVAEVSFGLPTSLRLKKVEGPDVGGWRVDGENEARRLTVSFLKKIDSQTEFSVEVFQALATGNEATSLRIVPLEPVGAPRESGRLGLYSEPQLSLRPTDLQGLSRDEVAQFALPPGSTPSPTAALQYAYRFGQRPMHLDVAIERRQAETKLEAQHGVFVGRRKLQISSRLQYIIAGAPRSAVTVTLPPGYLLIDVSSEQMSDYSVADDPSGAKILTVELRTPHVGPLQVVLSGVIQRRAEDATVSIPVPVAPDVAKAQSDLGVWVDDGYVASIDAAAEWKPIDPASLPESLRALRPQQAQFAFRLPSSAPPAVTIGLKQQSADLSAESLALIAVTDSSVEYGLTLQWRITRAATDTLSFTTPGWLRGRLDFAGAGIRQVRSSEAPNDRVRWTISLTDPVRDRFLLTAAASLPLPADDRVVAPDIVFEGATAANGPAPVDLQRRFAVVVNLSRQTLSLEDSSAVQTITRDNLPLKLPDPLVQQAMNIVEVEPGRNASWVIRRVASTVAAQATVTNAVLQTSLDWDGTWHTRATLTVRNRGRQFLPVDVPEGARLLSVIVRGQPTRTVSTQIAEKTIQLVPLPPSSEADLSYDVVLQFAGRLAQPLPDNANLAPVSLTLPAPRVFPIAESAEYGLPVAQTSWVVSLPEGVTAEIDDSSNLTSHQSDEWGLVSESRFLTQVEQDITEMTRIVSDSKASYSRRIQAQNNLKQLGDVLKESEQSYEKRFRQGKFSERGDELVTDNYRRNSDLQQHIMRNLSEVDLSKQSNEAKSPQVQFNDAGVNFRQGGFEGADPNAPQGGQAPQQQSLGRNFILGNSAAILNSNAITDSDGDINGDGVIDDFGFKADSQLETKAEMRDKELSGRAGLKRKAQEQSVSQSGEGQRQAGGMGGFGRPIRGIASGTIPQSAAAVPAPVPDFFAPPQSTFSAIAVDGSMSMETAAPATPARVWTGHGGLSLAMELPSVPGNSFAFSKSGGEPRLVLEARSTRTWHVATALGEALLWLAAGLWLLSAARHPSRLGHALLIAVAALSAVGFVFLAGDERWLAFLVFLAAIGGLVITHKKAALERVTDSAAAA